MSCEDLEPNKVYKGDDWKFDFEYTINGVRQDLSAAQEIRACVKGDTASVEVTMTGGEITLTAPTSGQGQIKFPKTKTTDAKKGKQNLLVEITDSDGDINTIVLTEYLEVIEKDC